MAGLVTPSLAAWGLRVEQNDQGLQGSLMIAAAASDLCAAAIASIFYYCGMDPKMKLAFDVVVSHFFDGSVNRAAQIVYFWTYILTRPQRLAIDKPDATGDRNR